MWTLGHKCRESKESDRFDLKLRYLFLLSQFRPKLGVCSSSFATSLQGSKMRKLKTLPTKWLDGEDTGDASASETGDSDQSLL